MFRSMLFLFFITTGTQSFSETEGRGGGDSQNVLMRKIYKEIGKEGKNIKPKLELFSRVISYFQALGNVPEQIQELVRQGFHEDIQKSKYVFKEKCFDKGGYERSASTVKGQRNADICISVKKLARENASLKNIAGLLMHEHARHFGLEDTDFLGIHPIAEYTEEKLFEVIGGKNEYRYKNYTNISNIPNIFVYKYPGEDKIYIESTYTYSNSPIEMVEDFFFTIVKTEGHCKNLAFEGYTLKDSGERDRPVWYGNDFGEGDDLKMQYISSKYTELYIRIDNRNPVSDLVDLIRNDDCKVSIKVTSNEEEFLVPDELFSEKGIKKIELRRVNNLMTDVDK